MTTKDSICVRCAVLLANTSAVCTSPNGVKSLISDCAYGGKNAGNRKKCINFVEADENTIEKRMRVLGGELF